VLATALTLSIIAATNGGRLQFADPARVDNVQSQINIQRTDLTTQGDDIDGLRTRIDNLETVPNRVAEIETDVIALQSSTDANATDIVVISETLTIVQDEITVLEEDSAKSLDIFATLRDLLVELFPTEPTNE
jgi:septal ring factor EnvC (AmiA/AmiB activator)